jgi:MAE_28990/MAE_18760-like HEPN
MATELVLFFEERRAEIESYMLLLQNIEDAAHSGPPRLKSTDAMITPEQMKILNSSLYLQLYNLVEATVSRCLDAIVDTLSLEGCKPNDLNPSLRREWVRAVARTHGDLNPGNRLQAAIDLCDHVLNQLPVATFKIEVGGGGNWDDSAIENICDRVGCTLVMNRAVTVAAKKHVRDEMGALKLVKNRRNSLAHGSLSFVDCSDGVSVTELQDVADSVTEYLRAAVGSFENFISSEIRVNEAMPSGSGVAS